MTKVHIARSRKATAAALAAAVGGFAAQLVAGQDWRVAAGIAGAGAIAIWVVAYATPNRLGLQELLKQVEAAAERADDLERTP